MNNRKNWQMLNELRDRRNMLAGEKVKAQNILSEISADLDETNRLIAAFTFSESSQNIREIAAELSPKALDPGDVLVDIRKDRSVYS